MQLMSREDDPSPIILDVDMQVVSIKWNDNGSILAIAGYQGTQEKRHNFIHFYSPWGEVRFVCRMFYYQLTCWFLFSAFTFVKSYRKNNFRLCLGSSITSSSYCHRQFHLFRQLSTWLQSKPAIKTSYEEETETVFLFLSSGVIFKILLFTHFILVLDLSTSWSFGTRKRTK